MARWNKPPAIAHQLDRCDVCGDKYHRSDLVRTQVEFLDLKAENFFEYSSYDGTFWVMDDATDVTSTTVGTYGNRCDNVRLRLDDDNNLTYVNSPKVWQGNGTLRMDTLSGLIATTSDVTLSAQVGPHEQNTSPEMTVAIGVCNSDGTSKSVLGTWTINTMTKVWVNAEVADLVATGLGSLSDPYYQFYYYFQITNAGNWWIDEMQYEANVLNFPTSAEGFPENFVRTSGSIISSSAHPEQSLVTSRKVCPNCRELVLSKSQKFGRTDEPPVADPVETWNQEF